MSVRAGTGTLRRALAAGATALLLAGSAAACGDGGDRVTVGSKFFTEQDILGEILATWIERTTDLRVERRLHLGGTFICHQALRNGELDLYVEYTGTALTAILEKPPIQDPVAVYDTVRRVYRERWDLEWLEPLGFENTFAILVRESMADSLGLETVSDLRDHDDELVPGSGYEFVEREDGYPGLVESYGLDFASGPRTMELGLLYRALADGQVDLVAGNSTAGQIEALDLRMLEDDRRYFPPYDAVPVVRRATLERHPGLRETLERLGGRIDTRTIRRLNEAVNVDGRDFREVARTWVEENLGEDGGAASSGDAGIGAGASVEGGDAGAGSDTRGPGG
jgi:glycine betaine/choline ABC-type transport system substrate-binding protein